MDATVMICSEFIAELIRHTIDDLNTQLKAETQGACKQFLTDPFGNTPSRCMTPSDVMKALQKSGAQVHPGSALLATITKRA